MADSIDPAVRHYFYMQQTDPERAREMLRSKAIEYMYEWKSKPVETWNGIMSFWTEIWKTTEEFEEELKNEKKG